MKPNVLFALLLMMGIHAPLTHAVKLYKWVDEQGNVTYQDRPPVIIFAVIPFALIGISAGLLVTGAAFGFMALLGTMSLWGMMIKNAVVLLDQVNLNLAEGMKPYEAIVESAVSHLRPVVNAAATTIFGLAPLLTDVFWFSMAVTIMGGLLFGTILTMVLVPVLYATLYRIPSPKPAKA